MTVLGEVSRDDQRLPKSSVVNPETAAKLRVIEATYSSLDEWAARMSTVFVPRPESELGRDDADWPYPPVSSSQIAWAGLNSAREHLQAVRVHIEARQLFPLAHLSITRAALIGAAQTVWVLGPDNRAERLKRSRLLAHHAYAEHLKFLRVLQRLAEVPHEGIDIVAAHTAERLGQIEALRGVVGKKVTLNTTTIIEQAAATAFGDKRFVLVAESIWRQTSGAAHGLAWSLLGGRCQAF